MNKVNWSLKALKQAKKIQKPQRDKITEKAKSLKDFPNCQNIKSLTNHKYDYRLRVGRYRVFFDYDGEVRIVSIEEVKIRDENTY
ncbi:type II toxin-antitoxin system RelE/ParE family toxin [Vibrio parahaemolyticus]|nr:type II toxin-antitoxin system RelE/ParE family toxin [Vibrio parahaemolyticus]EHR5466310.1 type II toxin-antitoxin system RelE/ParE family toxin [Vibrio parahaemolyticus]EJB8408320.1 type II toxin-antitoxin system RelE/ParE family toxin [Vibrio parahaemolyticus]ELA9712782.1 type II toxin-antitoxin system RelE/ParE family toxin [Vibrio parahaemolyticus]ELA9726290.1 type II toxin-antitoxin system RelE/ParE family toxin [Vibrio parahaemolyticus]